jgi:hypothetical protein
MRQRIFDPLEMTPTAVNEKGLQLKNAPLVMSRAKKVFKPPPRPTHRCRLLPEQSFRLPPI